jgi:hypothetical protein
MRHIGDSVLSLRSNNQDFVYERYYIFYKILFSFFAKKLLFKNSVLTDVDFCTSIY